MFLHRVYRAFIEANKRNFLERHESDFNVKPNDGNQKIFIFKKCNGSNSLGNSCMNVNQFIYSVMYHNPTKYVDRFVYN